MGLLLLLLLLLPSCPSFPCLGGGDGFECVCLIVL
jgi:hypothetical protein